MIYKWKKRKKKGGGKVDHTPISLSVLRLPKNGESEKAFTKQEGAVHNSLTILASSSIVVK